MPEPINVPVLFVADQVVLPGMVVPIALDDAARAAIEAARASDSGKLLIAPRLDDRYPSYGVIASILQVGRVSRAVSPPSCAARNGRTSARAPTDRAPRCGWR